MRVRLLIFALINRIPGVRRRYIIGLFLAVLLLLYLFGYVDERTFRDILTSPELVL